MSVVIKLIGLATGEPTAGDAKYVRSFDAEARCGRGLVTTCVKQEDALRFHTMADATRFYTTQSKSDPVRPDGLPNRPLTSYSVEFERSFLAANTEVLTNEN
jgi:hypothetical protein